MISSSVLPAVVVIGVLAGCARQSEKIAELPKTPVEIKPAGAAAKAHQQAATALAFTPDGKILVSGSADTTVKLWGVPEGRLKTVLAGHRVEVSQLVVFPDGRRLASGGAGKAEPILDGMTFRPTMVRLNDELRLWSLPEGRLLKKLFSRGGATALAPTPNGKMLISASADVLAVYSVAEDKEAGLGSHEFEIGALAIASDGRTIASASRDRVVKLWSLADLKLAATINLERAKTMELTVQMFGGKPTLRIFVPPVAFAPDSTLLATGNVGNVVQLWSVPEGRLAARLPAAPPTGPTETKTKKSSSDKGKGNWVSGLAFSSDGKTLAAVHNEKTVQLWSVPEKRMLRTLEGHAAPITHLAVSPHGNMIATASEDKTVKLWAWADGRLGATLSGHAGEVTRLAFAADGRTLASGDSAGGILLWDLAPLGCRGYLVDPAIKQ